MPEPKEDGERVMWSTSIATEQRNDLERMELYRIAPVGKQGVCPRCWIELPLVGGVCQECA